MTKYATYAHIGLAGLGALGKITEDRINANQMAVMMVLRKVDSEKKYKVGDTLSFDDIDKIYNVGISDDEKRAWVWYRLNNGVPMKGGWKKYYPSGSINDDVIVTTKSTEILDNAYRLITTVPKGTQLGRATKFKNQYGNKNMLIFVSPDGAKRWVNAADVTTKQIAAKGSDDYVSQLVKKGVLFYMDGVYFPYAIYAYGNMYERELQLKADRDFIEKKYGKDIYNQHAQIIERCKPRLISINNPSPTERPYISAISRFAREQDETQIQSFFITNLREETGIDLQGYVREKRDIFRSSRRVKKEKTVKKQAVQDAERKKYANADETEDMTFTLVEAYKIYLRTLPRTDFKEVSAEEIIFYYIEGGRMSKDDDAAKKETIEKFTPIEGEELFAKFLYEALQFEDQQKLDFLWNKIYNGFSSIPHHKVPIGFACSALFKSSILEFTPAQREAIAFMEIAGSGILAYDVGVGKTMSAIITMANNMQAGKYERPLLVVPNPTYKNWMREINGYTDPETGEFVSGVMSGLNIKINEYYNLGVKTSGKGIEPPAKGSISIMTYEGFAKMGLSSSVGEQMVDELKNVLMQNDVDTKSERDKELTLQKIRSVVGGTNKDTVIDIDFYGFDALIVDEAHNFKNIFDSVSVDENGDKRYDLTASQSQRGIAAFLHCNYIQRTFGANVMLLTATPFTNSPLEIFSMLSLVGYKSIKDMGYYNIQRFMQNFVLQSLEYVNSYDGEIELRPVVKSYKNRLVLQNLIHNHIAYKTGEEAGVKRPVKVNLPRLKVMRDGKFMDLPKDEQVLTYLKPTIDQQANQVDIYEMARNSKKLGEIGRALNKSLDNALSPYIYDSSPSRVDFREFVEGSPKINYTMLSIKSVKEWHESRGQQCSGQVIYINRGKDFFPHMKRYLEDVIGFKKDVRLGNKRFDEVEIIMSGMSNEAKEGIKDAFLSGTVKVIIGTATIREGINLQKRGSVLYNLYPDWNPTDIRQLEGRIWRQGNQFGYVRVVMPLLQDSMDVFVFQKLQEKTARINDIWFRSDRGNVLDQEALDPEEIKFALYTDINALVKMRRDQVQKDIARRLSINTSNIEIMNKITTTMSEYSANRDACMALIRAANTETGRIISAYQNDWKVWYQQIKNVYPFSSAISGDEKKAKAIFEKYVDYNKDSTEFLAQIAIDDKLVKSLAAKAIDNESLGQRENIWEIMQKRNAVGRFMMALSKLRKAENTILKDRGYNLNSNIKGIIDELQIEATTLANELENIKGEDWFKKNYEDIAEYKAKTAIFGESPEKRATQFATLNNLLGYSAQEEVTKDVPRSRGFALPENTARQTTTISDADKIKKLKLLKLKLRLQTQTLILKQKQAA